MPAGHELFHNCVGAFEVETVLAGLFIFEDDAHPFGFTFEREGVFYLEFYYFQVGQSEFHCALGPFFDREVIFFCHFDKCDLVGAGGLVLLFGPIFREDRGDVVAKGEGGHYVLQAPFFGFDSVRYLGVEGKAAFYFLGLVLGEFSDIIDGDLLEDHLVLGEGACFVGEDVSNSAQLLRAVAVSGDCPLDIFVVIDQVCVEQFGEVEVYPH